MIANVICMFEMNNNKTKKQNTTSKNIASNELKNDVNKVENKNTEEQKKKFVLNYSKLSVVFAVIILVIVLFIKFYNFGNKKDKDVKDINTNTRDYKNSSLEVKNLQDNIYDLEQKLSYDNEYIKSLETKIKGLENLVEEQNNKANIKIVNAVKILIDIQNSIENGKNYSGLLTDLENINGIDIMNNDIDVLKKYEQNIVNITNISKTFSEESKIFLKDYNILKKSNNIFAKFVSNFVAIRKINNPSENSPDKFIFDVENLLNIQNYNEALQLLEENTDYIKYFRQTVEDIKIYVLVNNTINKMINNLANREYD